MKIPLTLDVIYPPFVRNERLNLWIFFKVLIAVTNCLTDFRLPSTYGNFPAAIWLLTEVSCALQFLEYMTLVTLMK